jgi:hypothetical protein
MAGLNSMPGLKSDSDTSDIDDDLVASVGASASTARPFSSNTYTRNPYLHYLAPELHEDAPLSVATDVFSLGMTTWQLLHAAVTSPSGTPGCAVAGTATAQHARSMEVAVTAPPT